MVRRLWRPAFVLLVLLLLPSAAFAQAAITGVAKDASGAVLPGVTVEAASPALIEKVRSVVTDDTGQYRVVSLPPGTYSVTFSLPGFSTVKREGIQLTGDFVATVNGDLKVGSLEETITVTGETPIVDVQSAKVQQTVSKDIISAIPTSRTALGIQALIPGMTQASDGGGATTSSSTGTAGAIHGARPNDSNMLNNGMSTTWQGGNGGGGNNANVAGAQEVVINTSGGLGENEKSGVVINLIPREGGNTLTGTNFVSWANSSMQGNNYTQALKDQGLLSPQRIVNTYDYNPMLGGKILRDKLWFYSTLRVWGAENSIPGMFWNKNAGDVTKFTYDPDFDRPATVDLQNGTAIMNLTYQATPRNKFTAYWSEQWNIGSTGTKGGTATTAPEAQGKMWYRPSRVPQATWSSPLTSRILLEAGIGIYEARYRQNGDLREDGTFQPDLYQAQEQAGLIPNLVYRAPIRYHHNTIGTHTWRASASYVTGAHNMKFGYFGGLLNPMQHYWWTRDDGLLSIRLRNGIPNQLTLQAANPLGGGPGQGKRFIDYNRNTVPTSFYAQDQWTLNRLTLQGGVRYDHLTTWYPEQRIGDDYLVPVNIVYPERSTPGLNWNDITPRMGAAYDLFGNGKTAVKVNLGKYPTTVIAQDADFDLNPLARITVSTQRSWTDNNTNFVPDCNLANPAKNGECGADADQNMAKNVFSSNFDPKLITGWGSRPFTWELGASVQQQVLPRVSVTVGYFRRWFGNFYVTDNRSTVASDYDPFTVTVADPRLPGGSETVTVYDVKPGKFGQVDNYRTAAATFGKQFEHWDGVDVTVSARLSGLTVQGGTSTGRRVQDNCDVAAKLPEAMFSLPTLSTASTAWTSITDCHQQEPFLTSLRGLATYTIPRVELQVAGTWQSNAGPMQLANYNIPNAVVKPALGRDLAGSAANIPVTIVAPGAQYGPRSNQIDFRVAKIFKYGRTRTQVGLDVYNITNTDTPLTFNNGFVPGGSWLTPNSILPARWAKIGLQFDF